MGDAWPELRVPVASQPDQECRLGRARAAPLSDDAFSGSLRRPSVGSSGWLRRPELSKVSSRTLRAARKCARCGDPPRCHRTATWGDAPACRHRMPRAANLGARRRGLLGAEDEMMDPVVPPEELHLREARRLDRPLQPEVAGETVQGTRFRAANRTRTMKATRVFVG